MRATVTGVEPVEVNAGAYYLRTLRADDRVDDRPAVLEAFGDAAMTRWIPEYSVTTMADADAYIAGRAKEWRDDRRCSWAVALPATGELAGEVGLKHLDLDAGTADIACWTHPAHRGRGLAVHAVGAAVRFGFGALGLRTIGYGYVDGNTASARVAAKCGFGPIRHRLHAAIVIDGTPRDLLCLTLSAPAPVR